MARCGHEESCQLSRTPQRSSHLELRPHKSLGFAYDFVIFDILSFWASFAIFTIFDILWQYLTPLCITLLRTPEGWPDVGMRKAVSSPGPPKGALIWSFDRTNHWALLMISSFWTFCNFGHPLPSLQSLTSFDIL